jgi:thiosulfate reductase cytochrome b subunit
VAFFCFHFLFRCALRVSRPFPHFFFVGWPRRRFHVWVFLFCRSSIAWVCPGQATPRSERSIVKRLRRLILLPPVDARARFCAIAMAQSAYLPGLAIQDATVLDAPRHSVLVRITHWIHAASFIALVISGIAILLAHPRMYWGETGAVGGPSLFDLPLPFVLDVPIRGPGRYLHFLAAWVCILNGLLYALSGLLTQHFRKNLLPKKSDLALKPLLQVASNHMHLKRPTEEESQSYNVLQRLSYLTVVFILFPFMFISGFAMSPAIVSVFPIFVTVFGGQQTARTLHFFAADLLVLFLLVHVVMVILAGFTKRCRAMITGYAASRKEAL